MEMPPELQIQYLTPKKHFFTYISRSKEVSKRLDAERQFVLRFKEGNEKDQRHAANFVCDFLRTEDIKGSEYTFMCVPASTPEKNLVRYKKFCATIAKRLGLSNGFGLVDVVSERCEVHAGGSRENINFVLPCSLEGRKVVLFDDVETTGMTFASFAAELERRGAEVVQGLFLAQAEPC